MKIRSMCVLSLLALSSVSQAFDDANVLPKKTFRFKLVGAQTSEVKEQFNDKGQSSSYVGTLDNRKINASDVVGRDPEMKMLLKTLTSMKLATPDDLFNGHITADFKNETQTVVPALEYGVTDRLAIGIRIPIVRRAVKVGINMTGENNAGALAEKVKNHPAFGKYAPKLEQYGAIPVTSATAERMLFTDRGYEAPRNYDVTELGDIEVGAKYQFFRNDRWTSAVLGGFSLPTGTKPEIDNVFNPGSGQGNWAIGVQGFQDFKATKNWTIGANTMVRYFIPDTSSRAVSREGDVGLPSLKDEDGQVQRVTRAMAPHLETGAYTQYSFWKNRISAWTGYTYVVKGEDDFYGPGENLDYGSLEENSNWSRQTGEVGVKYSYLADYIRTKKGYPFEVSTLYNQTLDGTNVAKASYVRMDVELYF